MSMKNSRGGNGRKKVKKAVLVAVFVLLTILSGIFLLFRYYAGLLKYDDGSANYNQGDMTDTEDTLDINGEELTREDHVKNVLLIGIDSEDSSNHRSDAILLVSFNESTGQTVLTSFLRDMYVTIPDNGENRLNAAYAYGGASLLIKTLQYNFGIDIDNYALVGFSEFENIVNILGGVNIELTDAEIKDLELNLEGTNVMHMDGPWALRFVRIRKLDSDFGRTDRQRRLLASIYSEFHSASILDLNNLLTDILPEVTTDMNENDILNLVLSWGSYSKYGIVASSIPVEGSFEYSTIDKMSVLTIDLNANKSVLIDNIYNGALNIEENGILKTNG